MDWWPGTLLRRPPPAGPSLSCMTATSVSLDVEKRELSVALSAAEIAHRMTQWTPPAPRYHSGVFAKYAASVSSASEGAVTTPVRDARSRATTRERREGQVMKTGAEIIWECLEHEGVGMVFGYPGGGVLPPMTRCNTRRFITCWCATSRARRTWLMVTPAPPARSASPSPPPARAPPTSSPVGDRHAGFLAHRVHHRAGGQQAHRVGRFPGNRHHRHHPAGHQAQLFGDARGRDRAQLREAFYIARSGRPGPVLVDITKDAQHGIVRIRLGCRPAATAQAAATGLSPDPIALR